MKFYCTLSLHTDMASIDIVCLVFSFQSLYSDSGLPSSNVTGQSASLGLLSDQHRLDMVKAVADDIIKEKDNIIEQ